MFSGRQTSLPLEKLTVRILADVNDVDPLGEEIGEVLENNTLEPVLRLVAESFMPGIDVQLCLDDSEVSLQWLTESNIASWGMSRSARFSSAIDNLNAKVRTSQLHELSSDTAKIYTFVCEGVLSSSLILADRFLDGFGFAKEKVAAVIPNRDTYYFCDRTSQEGLDALRKIAEIAWNDEECPRKYRITKEVLIADERAAFGWVPLQQLH